MLGTHLRKLPGSGMYLTKRARARAASLGMGWVGHRGFVERMGLAAIAALLCTAAQAQAPAAATPDQDRARFTQLESQWNDAHLRGDAEALDRLWADELRVVVPRMTPLSKADALSFFRSGRMKFSRYETSELGVRVYGDTAVVSGRVRRARERAGQRVADDWRFTKVYVRTGDAWRVVAYHASEAGP